MAKRRTWRHWVMVIFATATNQAPEHSQPGEPGEEAWKIVELKVLADWPCGLSQCREINPAIVCYRGYAKIANYAFTHTGTSTGHSSLPRWKKLLHGRSAWHY